MRIKAIDLFHAYTQNHLTRRGGFLVSGTRPVPGAPVRYTVVRLRALRSACLQAGFLTVHSDGEWLEIVIPTGPAARPAAEITEARPLIQPLHVAAPTDGDFAFLFPPDPSATARLSQFLEKTFVAEASLSPEAGARLARELISQFALAPAENP